MVRLGQPLGQSGAGNREHPYFENFIRKPNVFKIYLIINDNTCCGCMLKTEETSSTWESGVACLTCGIHSIIVAAQARFENQDPRSQWRPDEDDVCHYEGDVSLS